MISSSPSSSNRFLRAGAGVVFAAVVLGSVACSGADDPASKDEGAAVLGDTPKPQQDTGKPSAGDGGGPTLGGDYHELVGAWESKGTSGPVAHAVFYDRAAKPLGHAFFADLRPSLSASAGTAKIDRVTGSYTVTRDFISLEGDDDTVLDGAYRYGFDGPNTLRVAEPAGLVTYERIGTYCDLAADCEGQAYPHLTCVGSPACVSHACGWTCGSGGSTK